MFGEIHHCTHLSLMFCFERLLIIDSIYLIDIGLFRLFHFCVCFGSFVFQGIGLFYLGY